MDPHPKLGEHRNRTFDVHGVAAEAGEVGDHQHVAGLEPVQHAGEAAALRGRRFCAQAIGLRDWAQGLIDETWYASDYACNSLLTKWARSDSISRRERVGVWLWR